MFTEKEIAFLDFVFENYKFNDDIYKNNVSLDSRLTRSVVKKINSWPLPHRTSRTTPRITGGPSRATRRRAVPR